MEYNCPYCHSMKKPAGINVFLPRLVRCIDCLKIAMDKEFIKDSSWNISLNHEIEFNKIK